MPTFVLHIGQPADQTGLPFIRLEKFEPGQLTVVDDTVEELPDAFISRCDGLLDELRQNGTDAVVRSRIGMDLYSFLESTRAGYEWLSRCKDIDAPGPGSQPLLYSYLHIESESLPRSLQHLPWELMVESSEENSFAPFRSANHLAVRGHPSMVQQDSDATFSDVLPRSILIAVFDVALDGLEPEQLTRAEPQAEIDAVYATLREQPGMWQVEVLRKPTQDRLKDALYALRPQILHFIGESSDQDDPKFEATQPDGSIEEFSVGNLEKIIFRMAMQDRPRLFILNGCRTADMASPERFGKLGTKGVLTNQAAVFSPPAISFIQVVYERLAKTGDIAQAVWEARVRLWERNPQDQYHWGIPVLTMYRHPERAIWNNLSALTSKARDIINNGLFNGDHDPQLQIDRLHPSRRVWGCTDNQRKIALIRGPEDSGKSLLLRMCVLTWKLRGHPAVLFDPSTMMPGDRRRADVSSILSHVCMELKSEFGDDLSTAQQLDAVIDAVKSPGFAGNNGADDTFPSQQSCQSFISILKQVATEDRPLMLAFDSLGLFFDSHLQNLIRDQIFLPIVSGRGGSTYLAIAAKEKELDWDILGWERDRRNSWKLWVEEVPLVESDVTSAVSLAHEYGARKGWFGDVYYGHGNRPMADWIETVRGSSAMQRPWFPVELKKIAKHFELQRSRRGS